MRTPVLISLILIGLLIIGSAWLWHRHDMAATSTTITVAPISVVTFACDNNASITASFYTGGAVVQSTPGQPPMPTGHVDLVLSDGRQFSLPQTLSADGARYSNGNPQIAGSESFVFWEKGNSALVLENNEQKTYTGCVALSPDPGGLPQTYHSGTKAFSFRYPTGYSINTAYQYQELGPGKSISGVKVTVPATATAGTNLSADTGVSVEQLPNTQDCEASLFLGGSVVSTSTVTDDGTTYSYAQGGGGAAGNLYEEDVYALLGTNPCTAVRYFIHSTDISNYTPGSIGVFDHAGLIAQFDAIRRTLVIAQ